jgi:recombination protein RecT
MSNNLPVIAGFTPEDLQTMQQTIAKGTSPAQFNLFVRTAAASGLNPFLNHIYCIVYGQQMSIQISVEGIVFLAKKVPGYQGIDVQLVHDNDEFEASIDKEGKWVIDVHKFKFPRGKVIAGYAIAYREGFKPFTVFMERDEVEHNLKGNNRALWEKYFNDFFKKHMVKRAAKGQFGIDISEDEGGMNATPSVDNVESYQRKDITNEATEAPAQRDTTPAQQRNEQPKANTQQTQQDAPQASTESLEDYRELLSQKFQELGLDQEESVDFIKKNVPNLKQGQKLTVPQIKALIKVIDFELEQRNELPEELE